MTRCAPGRFPDRTKKWTDEETRMITESKILSSKDMLDLLQTLNMSRRPGSDLHSVDSLRRKVKNIQNYKSHQIKQVEYLEVLGMMIYSKKNLPNVTAGALLGKVGSRNEKYIFKSEKENAVAILSLCGGLEGYLQKMAE
mmetsp:Transcript_19555/g.24187  ORF Transcript_19555/g.24187 Transcript_19555/m.24187 type:complete len:140 (-) Transcript_19555:436-855(-)